MAKFISLSSSACISFTTLCGLWLSESCHSKPYNQRQFFAIFHVRHLQIVTHIIQPPYSWYFHLSVERTFSSYAVFVLFFLGPLNIPKGSFGTVHYSFLQTSYVFFSCSFLRSQCVRQPSNRRSIPGRGNGRSSSSPKRPNHLLGPTQPPIQ